MTRTLNYARMSAGRGFKGQLQDTSPYSYSDPNLTTRRSRALPTRDTIFSTAKAAIIADEYNKAVDMCQRSHPSIEINTAPLKTDSFRDTSHFSDTRNAENLGLFLSENNHEQHSQLLPSKEICSPHTLILTTSAERASLLIEALDDYWGEDNSAMGYSRGRVKVENTDATKSKGVFEVGVGTPQSMMHLVLRNSLHFGELRQVVLDGSHMDDECQKTIFGMPQVFKYAVDILVHEQLHQRLEDGDAQILVF